MLHACNPYANIYQMVAEQLQGGALELSIRLVNDRRTNLQCYNVPTVDKVGALMVGAMWMKQTHATLLFVRLMVIFSVSLPYTVHTRHCTTSFSS
jgi:hypothetical protein